MIDGGFNCPVGVVFFALARRYLNFEKAGNLLEQGSGSTVNVLDNPIEALII